jgi:parallel beta-helix repeat protein
VTGTVELRQDLGPCPSHGLIIKQAVRLDCRGHRITGRGDGSDQYGVYLDGKEAGEVTGARVANCHVSGFLRGIRLRAARGNTITGNVLTRNGDFTRHVGYGLDVAGGSTDNLVENNRIQQSADEGVHIGAGSHGNRLVGNTITGNYRENLYVLGSDRGFFSRNTLGSRGSKSLYLKDSSGNRFEGNRFESGLAHVIGDSRDNLFTGNTFSGTGIRFQDYKGGAGPRGNRIEGGTIGGGEVCVRFTNSGGNVVADTALGDCRTAVEAGSTRGATDNMLVGLGKSRVDLDEHSTVRLAWRVQVRVQDGAGQPLAHARVSARVPSGESLFTVATDDTGAIAPQFVTAATRTGKRSTAIVERFTLVVTKPGFAGHAEEVTLAGHLSLVVTLTAS